MHRMENIKDIALPIKTGSGAHPDSYSIEISGSSPRNKTAGV